MHMRRIAFALALLAVATVASTPALADDHSRPCDDHSLRGSFGFSAEGVTLPASGIPAPLAGGFVASGIANYDGKGNFTLTATTSFNGNVQGPTTYAGTYSVNPDCSFGSAAASGATFSGVITDNGHQLYIMQANNGVVITGTAKARGGRGPGEEDTGHATCPSGSGAGSFGYLLDGSAGDPALPGVAFGPAAAIGVINVDHSGRFSMTALISASGNQTPSPITFTGTYVAGANCTFTLNYDNGLHFNGTVVNRNEVLITGADAGTAVIVRGKRI